MNKPDYHIVVCASFRMTGQPQGVCHRKGAVDLLGHLENEILDRGINAQVSSTGCLKQCEKGPIMVVHPGNHWYGQMDTDRVDEVLDALENGQPATALLM